MVSCPTLRRAIIAFVGCTLALAGWLFAMPAAPVGASTLTVTDCGDSGANTLRGQIAAASPGDTIVFAQDCTGATAITLTTTLTLARDVTIDGVGRTVIVNGGCTANCGTGSAVGGVRAFAVNGGVTASMNALTIRNGNSATYGGGILNTGTLAVTNSTLTGNSATNGGGGIFNAGTLTLTNSTLVGNSGADGGGINNLSGTATATNSTLTGNSASQGGGIFNNAGATLTTTNALVAGNTATGSGPDLSGAITSGGHNLIGTTSGGSGITNGLNGDIVTPTTLLGPLGSNGGPTQTIPLLSGSPAIGNGDATVCASTTTPAAAPVSGKDQRGFARPVARCAIGAFEPQQAAYTVGSTADTGTMATFAACQDAVNTTCKLRDAIAYASSGADTITFNSTGRGTITLTNDAQHGTLTLVANVTVQGPTTGAAVIVDGGCTANCGMTSAVGGVTVFTVNAGVTASLSNLTIRNGNNAGSVGGGIRNEGTTTVTNGTFSGNSAIFGGGIYNQGTLTLTNSTLSGNGAASGGAIFNNGITATVTNSTLSGNSATNGGGIVNNQGTTTVTNSTFAGNGASSSGGGIYIANSGTLTATNSTLSGNSATNGGGIYVSSGTVTVTNAVVAGNTATTAAPDLFGAITTGGNNLIGTTSGSTGITNGMSGDIVNPAPLLGPLGNYGGPAQTIPLLPGSPAIDAGDDTVCALTGVGKVNNLDQRGITRPQGTHCDIGAFESRGFVLAKTSGDNQSAPVNTAFANPLVVTVTSANSEPVNGGVVTFTGPLSGAGIAPSPVTATIGAATTGQASITPTANGTVGVNYLVAAAVATGTTPVSVTFTLTNTPAVSAISPASGSIAGGATVTITGAGFAAGATVSIGGTSCTNVQFVNSTTLRCTTGIHAAGAVDVAVTVGGATGTLAGGYTYGVVGPLPPNAPWGGTPGGPNPLPGSRPAGGTGGPPPPPLPPSRP